MRKAILILILVGPLAVATQFDPSGVIEPGAWAQDTKAAAVEQASDVTISSHPGKVLDLDVPEGQPASESASGDYVIGQGDVLEVHVWRDETLSRSVVVRPDGKVSLPLLQDVRAEGLTAIQLRAKITRGYSKYLKQPRVTVIVSEINSLRVSIMGRVSAPGVYQITGNTTLVEAISMAGGFTEWANKKRITVITHKGGKERKILINYNKIVSGKDPRQNILLTRGDTIVVP